MPTLEYKVVEYPFEYPFGIAKGVKSFQEALQLCYVYDGYRGFGETTSIHYYQADVKSYADDLKRFESELLALQWSHPAEFHQQITALLGLDKPFLISALDMAAWDVFAQKQQRPLYQVLGFEWSTQIPPTDYTIGVGDLDMIEKKIEKHPFSIYKIKLDGLNDERVLRKLQQYTHITFRIDANESWNLAHFLTIEPYLQTLQIDLIEQPFHRDNISDLLRCKEMTRIPLIADEAFQGIESLSHCIRYYDGVNIKLSKCAGITNAIDIINEVQKNPSFKLMLGSMSDGIIGSTALCHLAPAAQYLDIDGPLLLKDNTARGIEYTHDGIIVQPQKSGIGAVWV